MQKTRYLRYLKPFLALFITITIAQYYDIVYLKRKIQVPFLWFCKYMHRIIIHAKINKNGIQLKILIYTT